VARLVHFILPPVVTTTVLALLLFAAMYLLHHAHLGELNVLAGSGQDASSPADALAIAETALTTFLVCTGLILIIFIQPPTRWWVGGTRLSGDWRPTRLALGLLLVFLIISVVPGLRSLFLLSPLTVQEYAVVLGTVVIWLLIVRWIWRARLLGRFLGVDLGPGGETA
jgi:cation-transporting ATPase E